MKRAIGIDNPSAAARFLQARAAAGGGLVTRLCWRAAARRRPGWRRRQGTALFAPNAFVRIGARQHRHRDRRSISRWGRASTPGLPTLVAEELDADWAQVRVEGAPADAKLYNNLLWGPAQGTGGSTAIANSWEQLRKAGRGRAGDAGRGGGAGLERAGGGDRGAATASSATRSPAARPTFGELAATAAKMPVPAEVKLKDPKDFQLIGKHVPRKDSAGQDQRHRAVHAATSSCPAC